MHRRQIEIISAVVQFVWWIVNTEHKSHQQKSSATNKRSYPSSIREIQEWETVRIRTKPCTMGMIIGWKKTTPGSTWRCWRSEKQARNKCPSNSRHDCLQYAAADAEEALPSRSPYSCATRTNASPQHRQSQHRRYQPCAPACLQNWREQRK